jgi:hypothetical protein
MSINTWPASPLFISDSPAGRREKFISGASEDERKNTLHHTISNKQKSKGMSFLLIWRLSFDFQTKLLSYHHSKQNLRILFKTCQSPSKPSKLKKICCQKGGQENESKIM